MNDSATTINSLPDAQSEKDFRGHFIEKVGVSDLRLPFQFSSGEKTQTTVANWRLSVSLAETERGTHMSRFLEILSDLDGFLTIESLQNVCRRIRSRLLSDHAYLEVEFPWFLEKAAPATGMKGLIDLDVRIEITSGETKDCVLTIKVPATSLCPCSKSISEFGAHNQRCLVSVAVRFAENKFVPIEQLARIAEGSSSAQVFSVIKRSDEKKVTEQAYKNAKFAEDTVRDLASVLQQDQRISWYRCSVENFESIHNHNAFAQIESDKRASSKL